MESKWQFDRSVARGFLNHARAHIPYYEQVIGQCIEICQAHYTPVSRIVDVGCATGHTLSRLYQKGFTNLVGIDNSEAMLEEARIMLGTQIVSLLQSKGEEWPVECGKFDVILLNWTLHFIQNKSQYLQQVVQALNPGGTLVITDKVQMSDPALSFYHDYKRRHGVSEEQIQAKARSLEGVMHIVDVPWYYEQFQRLGFQRVHLQHAYWCFCSFVVQKPLN